MPRTDGVLVFGDLIDDVVVVPSGPIAPDTDTASSIWVRPGGSAANTAAWLATAGADVTFVGRCAAADVARHSTALTAAGVDAHLIGDDDLPTGTIIVIVEGERRTMLTERGANVRLSPADVDPTGSALVHATGYSLVGQAEAFARFVRRAHDVDALVSLNAGSVAAIDEIGRDAFLAASGDVDILIANAAEAALLTGGAGAEDAARALTGRHALVVVTAGSRGAIMAKPGGDPVHVPPAAVADAVDPTGAGDAFTAGLLHARLAGEDVAAAGRAGVELAARAVRRVGGRPS